MALTKEKLRIYQGVLDKWGADSQINMAIEEMAELISALQHYRRNPEWKHVATFDEVTDEIADVEIMMEQLKYIFSVNGQLLFEIKEKKLAHVKQLLGLT